MHQEHLQPIDRLDFAISALKGLKDLVAASPNLQEIGSDELAGLVNLLVGEMEGCVKELRKH